MLRRSSLPVALLLALALVLTGCKGKAATPGGNAAAPTQSQLAGSPADQGGATASAAAAACPSSNTKAFAKTRFLLHTAEGFGAFHRYLYKPFKAGSFAKGSSGRVKSFVKAGVAALFIKRQVRLASEDVKANPTLCKVIAAPLARLGESISDAVNRLKKGDASGIEAANGSIGSIEAASAAKGAAIKEVANPNLNG